MLGALPCEARVHFAAPGVGLTQRDILDAVAAVAPGFGCLPGICNALTHLAAAAGPATQSSASEIGVGKASVVERTAEHGSVVAVAASKSGGLHFWENPLFSKSEMTPGQGT